MSTFEELEEAPILSIARRECSLWWAVKTDSASWAIFNARGEYMRHESTEDLAEEGRHTVMATPAVPATAREALALAWELAHPAPVGRIIPAGAPYLYRVTDDQVVVVVSAGDFFVSEEAVECRTLDPEPEPDWLDAPAVLAMDRWDDLGREKVWIQVDGDSYKGEDGEFRAWSELRDVTPLYPKGQDA